MSWMFAIRDGVTTSFKQKKDGIKEKKTVKSRSNGLKSALLKQMNNLSLLCLLIFLPVSVCLCIGQKKSRNSSHFLVV